MRRNQRCGHPDNSSARLRCNLPDLHALLHEHGERFLPRCEADNHVVNLKGEVLDMVRG